MDRATPPAALWLTAANTGPIGPQARPSVLVVDDNPALRRLLTRSLQSLAHVHSEPDGQAALSWLGAKHPCDLVLCDLNLGDLTAFELMEQLEATRQGWRQRFIICTGGALHGAQRRRLQETEVPILRKPFGVAVLRQFVASHLCRLGAANEGFGLPPSLRFGA